MKLSAYRLALLKLADQALADYELQTMLTPTDTLSPFFGKDMVRFAEAVNDAIDSPQTLKAASIGGPPIPDYVNLETLPGVNVFVGAPHAPSLKSVVSDRGPTEQASAAGAGASADSVGAAMRELKKALKGSDPRGDEGVKRDELKRMLTNVLKTL